MKAPRRCIVLIGGGLVKSIVSSQVQEAFTRDTALLFYAALQVLDAIDIKVGRSIFSVKIKILHTQAMPAPA